MALSRILANDFARLFVPTDDPDDSTGAPFALHRSASFALPPDSVLAPFAQYPASIALFGLDGTTGFRINGVEPGEEVGINVGALGDIDGDGLPDIAIAAQNTRGPGGPSGPGGVGASYVLSGGHSFAASTNVTALGAFTLKIVGAVREDHLSHVSSVPGDVNGDGFDDILVGSNYNGGGGAAYVVFGRPGAFSTAPDLSTLDGANGFRLGGVSAPSHFSESLSLADVNGDGFADVVVGAPDVTTTNTYAGATYVYFGKAGGFPASLSVSSLNGTNGFKISGGGTTNERTGQVVSSAGDLNGDGIDDLIIGTMPTSFVFTNTAYVVFGHTGTFSSNLDLSALDGTNGFRLHGAPSANPVIASYFGGAVASAGDVNGDGIGDIIVGAPSADTAYHTVDRHGAAYVIYGTTSGFAADVSVTSLTGSNGFKIAGADADQVGFDVASAGDVNGDGFDDLIVGGPISNTTMGYSATGAAFVVFGGPSMGASISVSALDGSNGFELLGGGQLNRTGQSVSSAGDINGDGFADLIVGAPNDANQNLGFGYVVYGRMPDAAVTRVGTVASQTLAAGDFNDTLSGMGGNDNLYGNGGNDTLTGGTGADTFHFAGAGAGTVDTVTDYSAAEGDSIELGRLIDLKVAAAHLSDYVRFTVSGSDLIVQADTDGTGGGATWADVAVLTGAAGTTPIIKIGAATINQPGAGDDTVMGLSNKANLFDLSAGGNDTATGGASDDGFSFGATYTPADHVDGGAGSNDQIAVQGDYSAGMTLSGSSIVNVEGLAMLPGFNYHFTTTNDLVDAGKTFSFWSASMGAANHVFIDGSAEADGAFVFYLGAGADTAIGGSGADRLSGGDGADDLTGGGGADTFAYAAVSNSTSVNFDSIHDFAGGTDHFDLPGGVTSIGVGAGTLRTASFDSDLAAALGTGNLAVQQAVLFVPTSGDYVGHTFLVVDANGTAGYQAGADFVFDVTGMTGTLTTASFV
jgi:hypothetical protein